MSTSLSNKKFSFVRFFLVILMLSAVSFFYWDSREKSDENNLKPTQSEKWFAPYVDVTATPRYEFEKLGQTSAKNLVLSFIVSSDSVQCKPTWGKAYDLDLAGTELDLDRRIALLRQQGGDVAISFGGLLNNEMSVKCDDEKKLLEAYELVINRYDVGAIDFDIEGDALNDKVSIERRSRVLKSLQDKWNSENRDIAIWLTLPVAPFGLTESGTNAVETMIKNGVDITGVNIMTMNYGESLDKGKSLVDGLREAMDNTHRQLGILYERNGIYLNANSLWRKIGITPMIGQNDISSETFTLEDAKSVNEYVSGIGIIRTSMWSVNRDVVCGENYVNWSVVSDSCSGIKQNKLDFSNILATSFDGKITDHKNIKTVEDEKLTEDVVDDPANSPYQIWNEDNVYLQGTKIVWKKHVYQAKWWTQGDLPDNPVLQAWETPWQLLGPVLPGEKPIEQPTLPKNIYPEWSGDMQYDAGERVLYKGVPYQAKWWTQGDSPAASSANPTSSPWIALTTSQIMEILEKTKEVEK